MLTSYPASILNHIPPSSGIPFDSSSTETLDTIQLATYAKTFAITRQAIINDDLDAFTRVPRYMGRAAKRTVCNLGDAVLTGNPAMSDSVQLFHADHANLAAVNAAMSVPSVDLARAAMALQKDPDSTATGGLNIRRSS